MRFLFWNTHRNSKINPYIVGLVLEHNIDFLVLAEYTDNPEELAEEFYRKQIRFHNCFTEGCDRIKIWSSYVHVEPGVQEKHYSLQIVNNKFIVCSTHLMSDLFGDRSDERVETIRRIISDIHDLEIQSKVNSVIIIGDMNEEPYGNGCLGANGFHGLSSISVKEAGSRTINGVEYTKFYNPMWNLLGDFVYPPGTYYYSQAKLVNPFWHMLDQVIISRNLIPRLMRNELKIVTTCGNEDLFDDNMHRNKKMSDHFPIMCCFSEGEYYYG